MKMTLQEFTNKVALEINDNSLVCRDLGKGMAAIEIMRDGSVYGGVDIADASILDEYWIKIIATSLNRLAA